MNSDPNCESATFTELENWCRTLAADKVVEEFAYVGSGSMTTIEPS